MKPLFDMSDRDLIIASEEYAFECYHCASVFYIEGKRVRYKLKKNDSKNAFKYCSMKCHKLSLVVSTMEKCCQCQADIEVMPSEKKKSKSGRMFCNKSCSAKYTNAHKTTGTRRSKLECWLEFQLTNLFPWLEIHYNLLNKINNELDIYIPSLNLAIELNGIFHYKPIYGEEKFNKTHKTDLKKKLNCIKNNITLIVIDVSDYNRFTEASAKPFFDAILSIIEIKAIYLAA